MIDRGWATTVLAALAHDEALASTMRVDVGATLQALGVGDFEAPSTVSGSDLRLLASEVEDRAVNRAPTDGGQCTQAGCYTRERGCSSQYACSRTGPC